MRHDLITVVSLYVLICTSAYAQYMVPRGEYELAYLRGPVHQIKLYDTIWMYGPRSRPSHVSTKYVDLNRHGDIVNQKIVIAGHGVAPDDDEWTYRYNAQGRKMDAVHTLRDAWGRREEPIVRRYIYSYDSDTLTSVAKYNLPGDSLVQQARYLYDSSGRLTMILYSDGSGEERGGIFISYYDNGDINVVHSNYGNPTYPSDLIRRFNRNFHLVSDTYIQGNALDVHTGDTSEHYVYINDSLGNPLLIVRYGQNEQPDTTKHVYTYDSHGNWVTQQVYTRHPAGPHTTRRTKNYVVNLTFRREILYYSDSTGYPTNRRPRLPFEE